MAQNIPRASAETISEAWSLETSATADRSHHDTARNGGDDQLFRHATRSTMAGTDIEIVRYGKENQGSEIPRNGGSDKPTRT